MKWEVPFFFFFLGLQLFLKVEQGAYKFLGSSKPYSFS